MLPSLYPATGASDGLLRKVTYFFEIYPLLPHFFQNFRAFARRGLTDRPFIASGKNTILMACTPETQAYSGAVSGDAAFTPSGRLVAMLRTAWLSPSEARASPRGAVFLQPAATAAGTRPPPPFEPSPGGRDGS